MSDATKQQEEIVRETYEQWRHHPGTVMFLRNLEKMKLNHLETSMNNAFNFGLSDQQFRLNAYAAKTISTVVQLMTNFEAFQNQLNK